MISLADVRVNAAAFGDVDLVGISVGDVEVWPLGSTAGLVTVESGTTGTGILQWQYGGPAGAWQSTADNHYAGVAGATARLRFHGTSVTVLGAKDAHHGQVSVSLDGGTPTTVDMYAATRESAATIYASSTLADGYHDVLLTVLGTKATASAGTVVAIDRARVAATEPAPVGIETVVDSHDLGTTDRTVAYAGTWANTADNYYSGTAAATMTLRWTGTSAKIYGAKDAHHGQASVAVDGGTARTIDAYSATRQPGPTTVLYDSGPLAAGAHTLVLTVLGTKAAASTGTVVAFDLARVLATNAVVRTLTTESGRPLTTEGGIVLTTEPG